MAIAPTRSATLICGGKRQPSTNIGVDFSLWRGRVPGAIELYQTNTTDLLLSDQLPTSIGFNAVTRNIGETRNRGIEVSCIDSERELQKAVLNGHTDFAFYQK